MAHDPLDAVFNESSQATPAAPPAPAPVETPTPAPQEVQPAQPRQQAPEGQPRAPDGKFASKEPTPAPTPVQQDDPDKQPINRAEFKGYLEEREKRQKLERELAEARKQLQEVQQAPQPLDISSIQHDPALIEQTVQGARNEAVFTFSEKVARKEYGDETVQAAMDWGLNRSQSNPAFAAEYLRQEHPIDWAVKQFKRDKILSEIGDDPDAYIKSRVEALLAAQAGTANPTQAAQPAMAASPQPAATPAPSAPRSIASAPTAGTHTSLPVGPGQAFDTAFT